MARVRKIEKISSAGLRHYFLVDANFLANKHIPLKYAPDRHQERRLKACRAWWSEIEDMLGGNRARVYVPDICIAEAFKVLAKKYYEEDWFPSAQVMGSARARLSRDLRMDDKRLKAQSREVRYHDLSTNRDIIISVDRFYELFMKQKKKVQIADLVLAATAKYLMDFFDLPKDQLHIVTLDRQLREGIAKVTELPNAYDPTLKTHRAELVFV